jgi:hypothetical protein
MEPWPAIVGEADMKNNRARIDPWAVVVIGFAAFVLSLL